MSDIKQRYESVNYVALPYSQTHPVHLATLSQLHGLEPVNPRRCRYLEVGCASGENIIAMACALPESEFVGIDLSENTIAKGKALVDRLGLHNVRLTAGDLMRFPDNSQPYDYIVAHGFYSWVPEVVQQRLWLLYQKLLAPRGIGYISYNTYPGCYLRRMMWEMMQFHTSQVDDPEGKVYQAKAFLQFLGTAQSNHGEVVSTIRHEIDQLMHQRRDYVIYHDDLAPINTPIYFHQFVSAASNYGLQFLSEADYFEMGYIHLPEKVQSHLRMIEQNDFLLKEQYLDFLKLRRFRESLVCRAEHQLDRAVTPERVKQQLFTSRAQFTKEFKLAAEEETTFSQEKGAKITLNHPLSKLALRLLGSTYPAHWSFSALCDQSNQQLQEAGLPSSTPDDENLLVKTLLSACSVGLVDMHCMAPAMALSPPLRPRVFPLVAEQLKGGTRLVTNLMHIPVNIESDFVAALLQLCDGSRSRDDLIAALTTFGGPPDVSVSDRIDHALKQAVQLALIAE